MGCFICYVLLLQQLALLLLQSSVHDHHDCDDNSSIIVIGDVNRVGFLQCDQALLGDVSHLLTIVGDVELGGEVVVNKGFVVTGATA